MKVMKYRKVIVVAILLLIAFIGIRSCVYIDLQVSKKYETQLEGITKSDVLIKKAEIKAKEIRLQEYNIKLQIVVAIILIFLFLLLLLKIKKGDKD